MVLERSFPCMNNLFLKDFNHRWAVACLQEKDSVQCENIQSVPKAYLYPLDRESFEGIRETKTNEILELEPSPEVVFEVLANKYVNGILYGGMVESFVSEQLARMNAMDSATTNAEKVIDKLTMTYNRVRQSSITQEITEIVAGTTNVS